MNIIASNTKKTSPAQKYKEINNSRKGGMTKWPNKANSVTIRLSPQPEKTSSKKPIR